MEESLNFDQVKALSTNETQKSNFLQVDHEFLVKISEISEKQASMSKAFCEQSDISDEKCDEITKLARTHARASIFNSASVIRFSSMRNDETKDICFCGCKKGVGEPIPLCANEQEYTFLGAGILLFFLYLKHIRIILAFIMLSYGGFAFITNVLSQEIHTDKVCLDKYVFEKQLCQLNLISTLELKKANIYRYVQLWMILFIAIVWLFGVKFIKFLGSRKNQEITGCLQSNSDYTMRVSNLPFGKYHQNQLIEFIQGIWQKTPQSASNNYSETSTNSKQKLGFQSIQIIYDMKQCRDLIAKIKKLSVELTSLLYQKNRIPKQNFKIYKTKKAEFKSTLNEFESFRNEFIFNEEFRKMKSTTCALIQFKSAEQQQRFLAHFENKKQNGLKQLCEERKKYAFKKSDVIFERASEPSDLIWSNCEKKLNYSRFYGIRAALAIVICTSFAFRIFLRKFEFMKGHQCLTTALVLQLFNRLILNTQQFFVKFEYQHTKTELMTSMIQTSIFAQFINIIVGPIIERKVQCNSLYGEISLSFMTLNYQTLALLMMPIFNLMSPTFFFKEIVKFFPCLRRKMIRMLCISAKQVDEMQQIRPVLSYYEGPDFPLARAKVFTISLIFHALFYCHIQPVILIFLIVDLTLLYIILKYLLLRRCKIPDLTSMKIFECILSAMGYGSWIFCFGALFFLIIEKQTNEIDLFQLLPASIGLIVCVILQLNPMQIVEKMNNLLFQYFAFNSEFIQLEKQQKNQIASNLNQNRAAQKSLRKECFYQESNLQTLFNYEVGRTGIVENKDDTQGMNQLKIFCEGFLKDKKYLKQLQCKQFQPSLIPALKNHKKRRISLLKNTAKRQSIQVQPILSNFAQTLKK